MSLSNEGHRPIDDRQGRKQPVLSCVPKCRSCGPALSGWQYRIVGLTLLLIGLMLAARDAVKNRPAPTERDVPASAPLTPTGSSQAPVQKAEAVETTETNGGQNSVSLLDGNTFAAASDADFTYVPGQEETSDRIWDAPQEE